MPLSALAMAQATVPDAIEHGQAIYALEQLKAAAAAVDVLTRHSVATARAQGEPWAAIGAALGITKQAAQKRFGAAA